MIGRLLIQTTVLLATVLLSTMLQSQEGQYRSKMLIDPTGALEKGTAQSIEQLEQQLDALTDPYAKASVSRHLAREYIERQQYDKAIAYYEEALQAGGMSDIADREILRELSRVYMLIEDYASAALNLEKVLQFKLVPEATDYLLLARAWFRSGDYVSTVATLDRLTDSDLPVEVPHMRQALALYYQVGAYAQCAKVLHELLQRDPDDTEYWHQLAAIYLLLDNKREALDQLALAREKRVLFQERDILLLANLYAVNNQPFNAAHLLQLAMEQQTVSTSGEHHRKQFEFWLQAREKDKAIAALSQAAPLTGDTELYLYLAQLQSENENWQAMQKTLLEACSSELEDRYVSRANLLLGISQLKLGDREAARRSFINATMIGGTAGQAAQWLRFMEAEPVTKNETYRIVSPCYGSEDKRRKLQPTKLDEQAIVANEVRAEQEAGEVSELGKVSELGEVGIVSTKMIPRQHFFTARHQMTRSGISEKVRPLATRLAIKTVQAGGEVNGSLHLLIETAPSTPDETVEILLGFPTRGNPRPGGRYRSLTTEPFHCSYLFYEGTADGIPAAWAELIRTTLEVGYQPTGQSRMVFPAEAASGGSVSVELQLGIED